MGILMQLKVWVRLALIATVSVLALGIVALEGSASLDGLLHEERSRKIEEVVAVAHSVLAHFHRMQVEGKLGEAEAKRLAAQTIGEMRFGEGNYFWINDMAPVMIMHPLKPELDGRDLTTIRDPGGTQLFVDFVRIVRADGSGFVRYQWPKPGEARPQPKIAYVSGFAPWGWIVGSGVYVNDLRSLFWSRAGRSLALVAGGFLVTLLVSWVIGRSLVRQLGGEPASLASAALRIADGDLGSPLPVRAGDSASVCYAMGRMQTDLTAMIGAVREQTHKIG